ncbi:MAG: hypothetical protein Q8P36_02670 [bacterium]|nr:hypothetical protein [bacterium]
MAFNTEDLRLRKNILCISNSDPCGDAIVELVRAYDPAIDIRYKDPKRYGYGGALPYLFTPFGGFEGHQDIKAFIAAEAVHPIVKDYLAKHRKP